MWQKIKCWLGKHEWIDKENNIVGWCNAKIGRCSMRIGCSWCPFFYRNKCKHCGKLRND